MRTPDDLPLGSSAHRPALGARVIGRSLAPVLGFVWVAAACLKGADLAAFERVLEAHAVLPHPGRWGVPIVAGELTLGLWLLALPARGRFASWAQAGLVASLLGLLGAGIYLLLVPDETLAAVGCGCMGPLSVPEPPSPHGWLPPHGRAVAGNAALVVVNAIALLAALPKRARPAPAEPAAGRQPAPPAVPDAYNPR